MLGHALGDALGAPFEFAEVGSVCKATGKDWIEELCPFTAPLGPHGPWVSPTVPGTGTDDVRYNRLFLDFAVELNGRMPADDELARRLLDIYEHPGQYFPGFEDLARAVRDVGGRKLWLSGTGIDGRSGCGTGNSGDTQRRSQLPNHRGPSAIALGGAVISR